MAKEKKPKYPKWVAFDEDGNLIPRLNIRQGKLDDPAYRDALADGSTGAVRYYYRKMYVKPNYEFNAVLKYQDFRRSPAHFIYEDTDTGVRYPILLPHFAALLEAGRVNDKEIHGRFTFACLYGYWGIVAV